MERKRILLSLFNDGIIIRKVPNDDFASRSMGSVTVDHAADRHSLDGKGRIEVTDGIAVIVGGKAEHLPPCQCMEETDKARMIALREPSCLIGVKGIVVGRIEKNEVPFPRFGAGGFEVSSGEFGFLQRMRNEAEIVFIDDMKRLLMAAGHVILPLLVDAVEAVEA